MPAFQLGPCAAAIVSDNGATPSITIVHLATQGMLVSGRDAVLQLRDACNLALDAAEAFAKSSTSKDGA